MTTLANLLLLPPNRVRRNYRGGMLLDALRGVAPARDGDRPEEWIASTVEAKNPGLPPVAHEGLGQALVDGRPQRVLDLFSAHPEHYLGARHVARLGTQLGFLAKLLDSAMRLHVQAHPTAEFAQEHLNSRWGKLETYYVLGVRPGCQGYIRLGFQRPPSPQEWRRIVPQQDIAAMDACFDPVPVRPGEVWLVPGGLAHAIGEGLLVVEVMEPTDLVVRCEFEREGIVLPPEARFMQRDPDFALRIFDHSAWPVEQVTRRCRIEPRPLRSQPGLVEDLLIGREQTDCFEIRRLRIDRAVELEGTGKIGIGLVVEGAAHVRSGPDELALEKGTTFLLAAAAEQVQYDVPAGGSLTVLICQPGR